MFIYPMENSPAWPNTFDTTTVPVKSGKFRFTGKINGPFEIRWLEMSVGGEIKYLSGSFFIEPGIQKIVCNADSLREIPAIHNESMTEFTQKFLTPAYYDLQNIQDWEESKKERRNYIYQYAKDNPDSYVAIWEIIHTLGRGYNKQLALAYDVLSTNLRNSVPFDCESGFASNEPRGYPGGLSDTPGCGCFQQIPEIILYKIFFKIYTG